MIAVRVLVYDGPADWVEKTLEKSLFPDGTHTCGQGKKIIVATTRREEPTAPCANAEDNSPQG